MGELFDNNFQALLLVLIIMLALTPKEKSEDE